jgi:DNA-binding phage protein
MRKVDLSVAACVLMMTALPAQARDISKHDLEVCKWGAGMAGIAQQSKLSGTTLYSARKKLQMRTFSKPWMRKMALGITEQTYKSPSRLKPAAVKQTYYDGCVQHELARK